MDDWRPQVLYVLEHRNGRRRVARSDQDGHNQPRGTVLHVAQGYRYPASRAEDMQRREVEVARSTAWALARNEGTTLDSNDYPYSLTSPAQNTGDLQEMSCLVATNVGFVYCVNN